MPIVTAPNQRTIVVHRERVTTDFLGIKNENWQAAARNLTPHAMMLYFYLASNKDNYTFALSPAAVRQAIGMARSTYHDQFHKLVDKRYLVPAHGNTFDFYEVPVVEQSKSLNTDNGLNFNECPSADDKVSPHGYGVLPENIEIDNKTDTPNNDWINKGVISPIETREIRIPCPVATGKYRPKPVEKKVEFDF